MSRSRVCCPEAAPTAPHPSCPDARRSPARLVGVESRRPRTPPHLAQSQQNAAPGTALATYCQHSCPIPHRDSPHVHSTTRASGARRRPTASLHLSLPALSARAPLPAETPLRFPPANPTRDSRVSSIPWRPIRASTPRTAQHAGRRLGGRADATPSSSQRPCFGRADAVAAAVGARRRARADAGSRDHGIGVFVAIGRWLGPARSDDDGDGCAADHDAADAAARAPPRSGRVPFLTGLEPPPALLPHVGCRARQRRGR